MLPPAFRAIALPHGAVVPDYGEGGLYGLVGAIARFLSGERFALPGTPASTSVVESRSPVLVFILVDGLGDAFLQRFGAGSMLLAHRTRRITSVFPSTTASAVTTVLTGLPPSQHGLTGWFIDDHRFGGVIAPLPMVRRVGGPIREWFASQRLFPYRSLFQRRKRRSIYINPQSIAYSTYSRRHGRGARPMPYAGLSGMVEQIECAVASLKSQGGGYVHAYYPIFDALSHQFGSTSDEVIDRFWRIDAAVGALCEKLAGSGVEVVVSADHGFTDSPENRVIHLGRFPGVAPMLRTPLFGERRSAFLALNSGAESDFAAFVREELTGKGVFASSPELVSGGLFGPGPNHRRLSERTGTHALLMEQGWTVMDSLPGERPHAMLGVHGGLSPEEMWVPLVHVRC